jgi:hypothetical protein
MRSVLAKRQGEHARFTGIFARFGSKNNRRNGLHKTVLLMQITDEFGTVICDHMWFDYTREFGALWLERGDTISFEASVRPYKKGKTRTTELDYELAHPCHMRKMRSKWEQ